MGHDFARSFSSLGALLAPAAHPVSTVTDVLHVQRRENDILIEIHRITLFSWFVSGAFL